MNLRGTNCGTDVDNSVSRSDCFWRMGNNYALRPGNTYTLEWCAAKSVGVQCALTHLGGRSEHDEQLRHLYWPQLLAAAQLLPPVARTEQQNQERAEEIYAVPEGRIRAFD